MNRPGTFVALLVPPALAASLTLLACTPLKGDDPASGGDAAAEAGLDAVAPSPTDGSGGSDGVADPPHDAAPSPELDAGTAPEGGDAGTPSVVSWGQAGDVPVRGDFDGDGKDDLALWRPASADFHVLQSLDGAARPVNVGVSGDVPLPADFDGDRRADYVVYHIADVWKSVRSIGGLYVETGWGDPGDIPIVLDYDGDHKADYAVFRPSTGYEYYRSGLDAKVAGLAVLADPNAADAGAGRPFPIRADFDGDDKDDPAIWSDGTGEWSYFASTTNKNVSVRLGQVGDVPVAADYDGDGKAEPAIFRPSTGEWIALRGGKPVTLARFGRPGDVPAPGDYDGDRRADVVTFRDGVWASFAVRLTGAPPTSD